MKPPHTGETNHPTAVKMTQMINAKAAAFDKLMTAIAADGFEKEASILVKAAQHKDPDMAVLLKATSYDRILEEAMGC